MIVRKVAFEKTIGMPNYSNDRPIIVEADLEPGETKEDAWTQINQDMIAWHKKEYPHLYQERETYPKPYDGRDRFDHVTSGQLPPTEVTYGPPPVINIQDEKTQPVDVLTAIHNAPTLEELRTFKAMASADKSKDQTLYNTYCQRLKELSV